MKSIGLKRILRRPLERKIPAPIFSKDLRFTSFAIMIFSSENDPIPVTCLVLFDKGKVLAAQRSKKMDLPMQWEFPGGKVELGESEEFCLNREIQEELGIQIRIIEKLGQFDHFYSETKLIRLIPFLAVWDSGQFNILEHRQIRWIDKAELKNLDWAEADLPIVAKLEQDWVELQKKSLNYPAKN